MTFPRIGLRIGTSLAALAVLLALAVASGAASAASPSNPDTADPLQSDACRRAVASLQDEEAAQAARHASESSARSALPTPSATLQDARRNAARRCLASRADVEPPPGRFAQMPIVVEPVAPPLSMTPSAAVGNARALSPATSTGRLPPAPPPGSLAARRPDAVTSCDSGGCWASDGSRLQRIGPVLWGPRGACTVQGASLQCP